MLLLLIASKLALRPDDRTPEVGKSYITIRTQTPEQDFTKSKEVPTKLSQETPANQSKTNDKTKNHTKTVSDSRPNKNGSLTYSQLLPGSGDISITPDATGGQNLGTFDDEERENILIGRLEPIANPVERQRAKSQSNPIEANLDIPLVLRRQLPRGVATMRIKIENDQVTILKLQGQPFLRAVLFEGLSGNLNSQQWRSIFSSFHRREMTVILKYSQVYQPDASREFSQTVEAYRGKLMISIQRNRGVSLGSSGGIPLPDKHAELAKQRDRMHLKRLRESPAYDSLMTGEILYK